MPDTRQIIEHRLPSAWQASERSAIKNMHFTRIVYLDPSLVSEAYTEIKAKSPVTRITRSQDLAGSVGAAGFRIGGTMKESREFSTSSTQMFFEIEQDLRTYPVVTAPADAHTSTPIWVQGFFAAGKHMGLKEEEVQKELNQFMVASNDRDPAKIFWLATNQLYFSSGYDRLAADADLLGHGMWEPIEALLRPLFSNRKLSHSLFAPFAILVKE